MKRARILWVGIVALMAALGCGSSAKPGTPQCLRNSDCTAGGSVCSFGYCVNECTESKDCPMGQRCVRSNSMTDGGTGNACQAPEVAMCTHTSQCKDTFVCSVIDGQCREECGDSRDCTKGQFCTSVSHLCADPRVDTNYDMVTNELKPTVNQIKTDGGSSTGGAGGSANGGSGAAGGKGGGASGGSGVAGASGNGGAAGGAGTSGTGGSGAMSGGGTTTGGTTSGGMSGGGAPGTATGGQAGRRGGFAGSGTCPTSFDDTAYGDANALFTSGVAVLNDNRTFIFTMASNAPLPSGADAGADAAVVNGNVVYVQAFDPVSGKSFGQAEPLFQVADSAMPYTYVYDASIAPTGEIVLMHGGSIPGNGNPLQLWLTFLRVSSSDAGAAGSAGLEVVKTFQVESVPFGEPHVIWSVASQAFITSWKYQSPSWYTRVRRFTPDGRPAGGATNKVPFAPMGIEAPNYDDCQIGTSGALLGMVGREYSVGTPWLTLLDEDGLQVGASVELGSTGESAFSTVGGTTSGFVALFNNGSTVHGTYVPVVGANSVLNAGGQGGGGGGGGAGGGAPAPLPMFSFPSNASTGKMVSDDTGGVGGVGAVLLESGGPGFVYFSSDGSKTPYMVGTVISSTKTAQVGLANYRGNYVVSMFDSAKHAAAAIATSCRL